jgi:hypothetical protein
MAPRIELVEGTQVLLRGGLHVVQLERHEVVLRVVVRPALGLELDTYNLVMYHIQQTILEERKMFMIRLVPDVEDDSIWLVSDVPISAEELRQKLVEVDDIVSPYIVNREPADEHPSQVRERELNKRGLRHLSPDLSVYVEKSGYYGPEW